MLTPPCLCQPYWPSKSSWNTHVCIQVLVFRSTRTSWNTFVCLSVPRQKSKSPLKPYKSPQDHVRPLIWNIAVETTMSSIIRWWRRQRQRQIQRQRQWERHEKLQEESIDIYRLNQMNCKEVSRFFDIKCVFVWPLVSGELLIDLSFWAFEYTDAP